jgi:hypothetical protein
MEEKTEYYTTTTSYTVPTTTTTTYTTATTTTSNSAENTISDKTEQHDEEKDIALDDEKLDHISDSNEHGQVEEYDQTGNLVNFVMSREEKRLVNKLDFIYVMPFVCILNFLQVRKKRDYTV